MANWHITGTRSTGWCRMAARTRSREFMEWLSQVNEQCHENFGFGFGRWRGRRPQRRCSLRGEAVAVHQRRRYVDRTLKLIYS